MFLSLCHSTSVSFFLENRRGLLLNIYTRAYPPLGGEDRTVLMCWAVSNTDPLFSQKVGEHPRDIHRLSEAELSSPTESYLVSRQKFRLLRLSVRILHR